MSWVGQFFECRKIFWLSFFFSLLKKLTFFISHLQPCSLCYYLTDLTIVIINYDLTYFLNSDVIIIKVFIQTNHFSFNTEVKLHI